MHTEHTGPSGIAPHGGGRGDQTRLALVQTALRVFAAKSFEGASTREIAEQAGVNQALIGYHFRNKQGLYMACFEHIAEQARAAIAPHMQTLEALLGQADCPHERSECVQQCGQALHGLLDSMLDVLLSPSTQHWVQLIVREQAAPTQAFEVVYDGYINQLLSIVSRLLLHLRGDGDMQAARIRAIALVGQVLIWRVGPAAILRHTGWGAVDEAKRNAIREALRSSIRAFIQET